METILNNQYLKHIEELLLSIKSRTVDYFMVDIKGQAIIKDCQYIIIDNVLHFYDGKSINRIDENEIKNNYLTSMGFYGYDEDEDEETDKMSLYQLHKYFLEKSSEFEAHEDDED